MSQDSQTWGACSPEILGSILKYTMYETLLNCMQVNKFWRLVSIYIGNKYGQWQQLTYHKMTNGGVSFNQRTKLNFLEIYQNSLLWQNVQSTDKKLYHTYQVDKISKINVYCDNLIVVTQNEVKYFQTETCQVIRRIPISCIDYDETDYIILEVQIQTNSRNKILTLKGKTYASEFECGKNGTMVQTDVVFYKLENAFCYIVDNRNVIWQHKWNYKSWKTNALCRYFGQPNTLVHFGVYCNEAYLYTTSGNMLKSDKKLLNLKNVCQVSKAGEYCSFWPDFCKKHFGFVLAALHKKQMLGEKDPVLEPPWDMENLTASMDHGDYVILGYNDGSVLLQDFENRSPSPIKLFNILEFMTLHDGAKEIVSLNVYESENSHHVFVATKEYIFQVQLRHND